MTALNELAARTLAHVDDGLRAAGPVVRGEVDATPERLASLLATSADDAPSLLAAARDRSAAANAARAAASELALGGLVLRGVDDALRGGATFDDAMRGTLLDGLEQYRYATLDLADAGGVQGGALVDGTTRVTSEEQLIDHGVGAATARRERAALTDVTPEPLAELPRWAPSVARLEHYLPPVEARRTSLDMYEEAGRFGVLEANGHPRVDLYDAIRVAESLRDLGMPFREGLEHGRRILHSPTDAEATWQAIRALSPTGVGAEDALRHAGTLVRGPLDAQRVADRAVQLAGTGVEPDEAIARAMRQG